MDVFRKGTYLVPFELFLVQYAFSLCFICVLNLATFWKDIVCMSFESPKNWVHTLNPEIPKSNPAFRRG